MTRPKGSKNRPKPPSPSISASNFSEEPAQPRSEEVPPIIETVETDVEDQGAGPGFVAGLLGRAADNLNNTGAGPSEGSSKRTRAKWTPKDKRDEKQISTLIVAMITMLLSGWNVPEDLKPTAEEVDGFSVPLTSLIVRHVPAVGALTPDALDMIGIIAVISAYYTRTAPAWQEWRLSRPKKVAPPPTVQVPPMRTPRPDVPTPTVEIVDPIAEVDPAAGEFLKGATHGSQSE